MWKIFTSTEALSLFGNGHLRKAGAGKRVIPIVVLVAFVLFLSNRTALSDELSELKQQMEQTKRLMQQMQERIEQLEARQRQQERLQKQKIETEVEEKVEQEIADEARDRQATVLPDSLRWIDRVGISGDFRYRQDHLDKQDSAGEWQNGVYRHKIRARLKFDARVNDEWDLGFRIATGNNRSPKSANQDLEDAFSKKEIWLDQAFFNWHPVGAEGLNVTGGKIQNPFYRAGRNQFIWDNDLNPEGIASKYRKPLNDTDEIFFNGGALWVDESSSVADASLWAAQTYWKRRIGNPDHVLAGATYYDYGNIEGRSDLKSTWDGASFYGNTAAAGRYKDDYNIVEIFGEYSFKSGSLPTTLFTSWVRNIAATTSEDTGYVIGAKFNKVKNNEPGSWVFGYDYRETDADAVVGGFNESDFLGAQTNSRGHRFVFSCLLARNLYWNMAYYLLEDTRTSKDLDYRRLLADLVLKF